ncbi:hypothetical protein CsSME_00028632 [Camellia sinensis var. sinensis]
MARNTMKMILNDFDSDDKLQLITIAAMEEERLNKERCSRRHSGSIEGHAVHLFIAIEFKAMKDFIETTF